MWMTASIACKLFVEVPCKSKTEPEKGKQSDQAHTNFMFCAREQSDM